MIEALVAYFQDRGFLVRVSPSVLHVRKKIAGEWLGFDWAISRLDLQRASEDCLFQWAEDWVTSFNQAVAERQRA